MYAQSRILLVIIKDRIPSFVATWMQLKGIAERHSPATERQVPHGLPHMWYLKRLTLTKVEREERLTPDTKSQ